MPSLSCAKACTFKLADLAICWFQICWCPGGHVKQYPAIRSLLHNAYSPLYQHPKENFNFLPTVKS